MPGPVKCTYLECRYTFSTEKEMKAHKKADHEYCRRCDYDAEDWDDLLAHKVDSMAPYVVGDRRYDKVKEPRHIVCEFCGEDFKSFGGRDLHRTRQHQADQYIVCRATQPVANEHGKWSHATCGQQFLRPSMLIQHYESDECDFVSARRFKKLCHQRYIVQQIWQDHTQFLDKINDSRAIRSQTVPCDIDDEGVEDGQDDESNNSSTAVSGGIKLDLTASDASIPRVDLLSVDDEAQNISTAAMHPKPALNVLDMKAPMTKAHSFGIGSEISDTIVDPTAIENATAHTRKEDMVSNIWHSAFWDPSNKAEFNIDYFYHDVIGKYLCPFPNCDAFFLYQHKMEEHLRAAHKLPSHCPSCFKQFASVTAIVAHFEASERGARKCIVARRSDYKSLLFNITGGFLSGKHVQDDEISGIKAKWVRSGGQRMLKLVKVGDPMPRKDVLESDRGEDEGLSKTARAKAGPGVMKFRYDARIPEGADKNQLH